MQFLIRKCKLWSICVGIVLQAYIIFPVVAQSYKIVHFSTGTGFFVNRDGYILTNAHVVDKCKGEVVILGAGMDTTAYIKWIHPKHDVALLQTRETPFSAATFRSSNMKMNRGDTVVVVGHPGGKPLTTYTASFIENTGPLGESEWLRFSDVVAEGNSGGPLLDASGQVIGMIVAKATTYRYNENRAQNEVVANADVAIQPYVLQELVKHTGIYFNYGNSDAIYAADRVEDRAREFVVQVKCQID